MFIPTNITYVFFLDLPWVTWANGNCFLTLILFKISLLSSAIVSILKKKNWVINPTGSGRGEFAILQLRWLLQLQSLSMLTIKLIETFQKMNTPNQSKWGFLIKNMSPSLLLTRTSSKLHTRVNCLVGKQKAKNLQKNAPAGQKVLT